ncbi:hypothetical protein ABZ511_11725 [Nocardia gamkensis]|uniref:hypothetical protein n=1 Tax=Nocardia TaxID=1817 RepID=UPI0033F1BF88
MKHAGMRIIAAAAITLTAATAAPATATAEPVAAAVEVPPGVVDAVRGAIASVLFFGIVGLCVVRVLPPDQCHLF